MPKAPTKTDTPHTEVVLSQNEKRVHKEFINDKLSKLSTRSGVLALLLVVGSVFLITQTFANSITKTFASEDGYVNESQPAKPFSKGNHLRVRYADGSNEITYIKFNVSQVSGKKVNSAKLRIRSEGNASKSRVDVYLVPNLAPITGSTWNTQPSLAGAQKIGSLPSVARWTWNEVNLTRPAWADGPVELALVGSGSNEVLFSSIESKSVPQLLFDTDTPPVNTGSVPIVTITANPQTLTTGGNVTLTWFITNAPTGCLASGDWTGVKGSQGNEIVTNLTAVKTYNFVLTCTNAAGDGLGTAHATVNTGSGGNPTPPPPGGGTPAPVVSLGVQNANVTVGSSVTLNWFATNNPTSCTSSGDWQGPRAASGTASSGVLNTARTYTFNIACSNSGGSNNASVSVVVSAPNNPPPQPPPTGGGQTVGVPYICHGPVNNLRVVGSGNSAPALLQIASGCTGTLSFDLTLTDGASDGVKVQGGAHDVVVTSGRIICQGTQLPGSHQDGIQVQGGNNVVFRNTFISCPHSGGAGAFYIDGKDFPGISGVICDTCDLRHYVIAAIYTGPATNSGVRNSVLHQSTYQGGRCYTNPAGGNAGMVNDNNTCVP